jgi:2-dehydro-3-deoxyphosphogluconate aldolase/(4S)-4-hydroxy-2-oxoglutarate aldolase
LIQIEEALRRQRVLAIVRYPDGGDVSAALWAIHRGGLELAEITLGTPDALALIERATLDGLCVGAGTVKTAAEVRHCADAGARFIVSPAIIPEVVEAAQVADLPVLPGVYTSTEVAEALRLGASILKLFPAGLQGPEYLKALRAPYPDVAFVPTGAITVRSATAFLKAGAVAVAIGADLVGRRAPDTDQGLDALSERVRVLLQSVEGLATAPPEGD